MDPFAHRRNSPQVGSWAEAEMWDGRIKEPISGIGYFLFTGDIQFGTPGQDYTKCIFDSSSQYTATFTKGCKTCKRVSSVAYDPSTSSTYKLIQAGQIVHSEDGFTFKGDLVTDKMCLGNGDPHTTVCLNDHRFYAVN